jgi:hypothetical protein
MYRIDNPTAVAALPSIPPPGPQGFFVNGNPQTGLVPTRVDDWWLNTIQEEIMTVIGAVGMQPNKNSRSQLYEAIQAIAYGATPELSAYLPLTGGTLAGPGNLTVQGHLAVSGVVTAGSEGIVYAGIGSENRIGFRWNPPYVQAWVDGIYQGELATTAGYLPLTGGTLANPGNLTVSGTLYASAGATISGTTMTNALDITTGIATIGGEGIVYAGIGSANRNAFGWTGANVTAWVDGIYQGELVNTALLNGYLPLSGGTLSGTLICSSALYGNGPVQLASSFHVMGGSPQTIIDSANFYVNSASAQFGGSFVALSGATINGTITTNTVAAGEVQTGRLNVSGMAYFHDGNLIGLGTAGTPSPALVSSDSLARGYGFWSSAGSMAMGPCDVNGTPIIDYLRVGWNTSDNLLLVTGNPYNVTSATWHVLIGLQREVVDYDRGLDAIRRLRPVTYRRDGDDEVVHGLVPAEAFAALPEIRSGPSIRLHEEDEEEVEPMNYGVLTFALVNAVKELANRLDALEGTELEPEQH